MSNRYIFICDDSLEGIFSGVYTAWEARVGHENVELRTWEPENLELFCEYIHVDTEMEKAEKVLRTMKSRLGEEITECICFSACSRDKDKGTAIYRTLVDCLSRFGASYGKKRLENRKNPWVRKVLELHRNVWNEYHHYLGFLRFRQIQDRILFSVISPVNDLLLLFQEHFGDRFSGEYWIIYDDKRKKALLHEPHRHCTVYAGNVNMLERLQRERDTEEDFEKLFQGFCTHISIEERKNMHLQQQNLPLRFRIHMVEFDKK